MSAPSAPLGSSGGPGCPQNVGLLALHAGNDASPEEAAALRRHLGWCADCQNALIELRATREWVRSNLSPPVDAAVLAELRWRVVSRLSKDRPFPWPLAVVGRALSSWRRLGRQPVRGLAVAALLMVGALGALSSLDGGLPRPGAFHPIQPGDRLHSAMAPSGTARFSSDDDVESDDAEDPVAAEGLLRLDGDGDGAGGADDELASGPGGMRIEMQTPDPNVRIIWFASNATGAEQPGRGR